MSGTDPDPKRRQIDRTQAFRPDGAAPTPPPDPNLPKIPGITLHYELARGGMGVVYSGRQDFLDRRVAVKLLSVELGGESFVQRFQREAKILAGIKHPNIVSCHMAGQTDEGQSYLVMEFIDGPSLKKWITDNGPVPVKAALRTARAVGQALGHAHTLGIIHRDVKPENILLETVTSTALDVMFPFTPKVVDLGLARASEGNASLGLTSPGSVMGTPATMSPEQYDEPDSVDFRTDIYGLGCALFEMLTGKPAFRGKKLSEIVARKREPMAPDPCGDNPEVPSAVGLLVQSMLAPERENRPASYKELDEMFASLLDVLSASAARPGKAPIVGDETITGSFRPTRPGDLGENATIVQGGGQKPAARPEPEIDGDRTMPQRKQPKTPSKPPERSGPGLLQTGEINFLAEGLGAPMGEQGGDSPFRTRPPGGGAEPAPAADVWATKPPAPGGATARAGNTIAVGAGQAGAAASSPPAVPARSKNGLYAAVAVAVVLAGGGIWFAMRGSDEPKRTPIAVVPPNPETPKPRPKPPDPKPANLPPELVLKGPGEVAPKRQVTIVAEAKDPDGDAAKLGYSWSFPLELAVAKSATNTSTLKLELDDGLPGVTFEVTCAVTDGANGVTTQVHPLRVADYLAEQPWIGLRSKPEWQLDGGSTIAWSEVPLKGYLSCAARQDARWVQTSQGDEAYWEWFGFLESDEDQGTPFATLGLRVEFGDAGWAVVVSRPDKGATYTIDVMQAKRSGETWTLAASDQPKKQWAAVADTDDQLLGAFSLRRVGKQLVVRYGHALVPEAGTPAEQEMSEFTVPVPDDVPEQKITLFADKGIGRFHVKRR